MLPDGFLDFLFCYLAAFPRTVSRVIHLTEKPLHFDLQQNTMRRREILVLQ
jgi:hypothetical protein